MVLADRPCNSDKSDLLAAPSLVADWTGRNAACAGALATIAEMIGTDSDAVGTLAVARSIYGHLSPGDAPLWQGRGRVVASDPTLAVAAMAGRS